MIKRLLFLLISLLFVSQIFAFQKNLINETQTGFSFQIINGTEPQLLPEPGIDSIFTIEVPGAKYIKSANYLVPVWSYRIALPTMEIPQVTISNAQYKNLSQSSDFEDIITNNKIYEVTELGLASSTPTATLKIYPLQKNGDKISYISNILVNVKYASKYNDKIEPSGLQNPSYLNEYSSIRFNNSNTRLKKIAEPSFPSGKWLRITITDEDNVIGFNNQSKTQNIFKISYDQLKDAGISETSINKNRIYLYSSENFGTGISGFSSEPLVENAHGFSKSDENFASGDFIYFYGNSPSGLRLTDSGKLYFNRNPYSFENYYWILIADDAGTPKAISTFESSTQTAQQIATSTEFLYRKEREKGADNVLKSGNDWYGKIMDGVGSSTSETFVLPASDNDYPTDITIRLKSGSEAATQYYDILLNNTKIYNTSTKNYGSVSIPLTKNLQQYSNTFSVKFTSGSGKGYLDYLQCEYDVALDTELENCLFFAPKSSGIIEYKIDNNSYENVKIFDITDPSTIRQLADISNESEIIFRDENSLSNRKTYLMVSELNYSEVNEIEIVDSPNFTTLFQDKSAEYIIITDASMISAANDIAEIHSSKVDASVRLSTFVTTQEDIFYNFNGGVRDPEAIRSFLHYAYENWTVAPKYVLLLGDGSFDHRGMDNETQNFVMTYQERYSDAGYDYYATDFHFTYISGDDKYPDIAIGRVPASDLDDANNYAKKLEDYLVNKNFGPWRHRISLVADDPEDPETRQIQFTRDSEILANNLLPDIFTYNKLYLLEYPDSQDDSKYGRTKPAATAAILEALKNGTTIINYMGHGAPTKWAQEYAFTSEQLPEIDNEGMLPFWIAGTCTWGKFDEIYEDCMPEDLITMSRDGGIAALGATRPTYLSPNFDFLQILFNYWFPNNTIKDYRIGDVIKNNLNGSDRNDEKYILFGDPAIKIALPFKQGNFAELEQDTLKALENIKVSGTASQQNFTGNAIVTLFDSKQTVTRYYTDRYKVEQSYSYKLPGDLLFKGNVKVEDGQFNSSFYIPKDLNYSSNFGKLHVYGWNSDTHEEFAAIYDQIIFAGSENVTDSIGPKVEFLKNDQAFYDGGMVTTGDQLQMKLTDMHGINLTGKMGHGISVIVDDNGTEDLTANFSYLENNDTSGVLTIPMEELEFGNHDIIVKAWDNANNSTSRNFNFNYNKSEDFKISKVVNYPNPFKNTTDITFYSTELCEFSIAIYSVNGAKIREFDAQQSSGDGFTRLYWDGKDDFGDDVARGIYFYKIKAKSLVSDQKDNHIGKMVKG